MADRMSRSSTTYRADDTQDDGVRDDDESGTPTNELVTSFMSSDDETCVSLGPGTDMEEHDATLYIA
jgi:hypothetical protein